MSKQGQEETQYFLENMPSRLTESDAIDLRRRLDAMGIEQPMIEQAIADIDTCLKKEWLRLAEHYARVDTSTTKAHVEDLRDAAAQFVRAFTALDPYSAYVVSKQLDGDHKAGDLDVVATTIRWIDEACASILSNWPEQKRQAKATASFVMLNHRGTTTAFPVRDRSNDEQDFAKRLRGKVFVSDDKNTKLTVRECVAHDFGPIMKDIADIWSSISNKKFDRSRKGINTTSFSPVAFVHFILSKVHDGTNEASAETRIRDYERAQEGHVKPSGTINSRGIVKE